MGTALKNTFALTALASVLGFVVPAGAQQPAAGPKTLKMQSSWPASLTLQDNFRYFAERVKKADGPTGQITQAYRIALSRDPTPREMTFLARGLKCGCLGENGDVTPGMFSQPAARRPS